MKTKKTMLSAVMLGASLLITSQLSAQVDWHVVGNTGTTSSHFVGTADNQPLRFRTNNAERIRILGGLAGGATTGFVGINTPTPTANLHVNGKTRTTTFQMTNGAVNGRFLRCDASGNASWQPITVTETDPQVGALSTSRVPRWSGTALVNGTIFDNATNVGIGTTLPSQKLHVVGNILATGNVSAVNFTGSGNLDVSGYIGFGSVEQLTDGGANTIASNSDIEPLNDNSRDLGSAVKRWNDVFAGGIISTDGNIGIGTTAPAAKLDIFGTTGAPMRLRSTNAESDISYESPSGNWQAGTNNVGNGTNSNQFFIFDSDYRLTVQRGTGNVGIGTAAPTQKLDVRGNISGTNGDLYLGPSNGVINAGGGLQNALINMIGDLDQHSIVNGDEDLYIQGALEVGNVPLRYGSGTWATTSDARLTTGVQQYTDGLQKLLQINPVTFNYNSKLSVDQTKKYVGVVAQEIQEIAPYMVEEKAFFSQTHEDDNGQTIVDNPGENYLTYDANALTYMLVNAVKEQQEIIETLKEEVAQLKSTQVTNSDKKEASLGSYESARLEQNAPNPFSEETSIRYYLPNNSTAVLKVMTIEGQEVLSQPVLKTGNGQIIISGSTMQAGTYTYTLIVNGKAVESKIMVLTR